MTSDGEALFRAICEQTQEYTPRLVFADWLQENGHDPGSAGRANSSPGAGPGSAAARAEFIRLQCEAWALCPAYPTPAAARTRASALLRAFRDQWDAELPTVPGLEWGDLYVRGFIDAARAMYFNDVRTTLEAAFAATPLRFLNVTSLLPGQLRELLSFPLLGRLTGLSLPGILGNEEARLLTDARERFPNTQID